MSRKPKLKAFQAPKGMNDVLPSVSKYWEKFLKVSKEMAAYYGFETIGTPILESAELFKKGIGGATDIVEHEMYTLKTKGGDFLALRPELTAGAVRAYIENGFFSQPQPVKFFHWGPVFRHESPQAGRYRQFHQADFDVIGEGDAVVDVQVIQLIYAILCEIGLKNLTIRINSIGDKSCWNRYRDEIKMYYRSKVNRLCRNCKKRFKENPLRLLDCKEVECVALKDSAPNSIDYLDKACHDHFKLILEFLDELGLPYILDSYLVRGLDYYARTVFEVYPSVGETTAQSALGGGGRYDLLVEQMGGKPTPASGFSLGLERSVSYLKQCCEQGICALPVVKPDIFVAQLGDQASRRALKLVNDLRNSGIKIDFNFSKKSLKAQLDLANELKATSALILGQKEVQDNTVIIRDMESGVQEIIDFNKAVADLQKKLFLNAS